MNRSAPKHSMLRPSSLGYNSLRPSAVLNQPFLDAVKLGEPAEQMPLLGSPPDVLRHAPGAGLTHQVWALSSPAPR